MSQVLRDPDDLGPDAYTLFSVIVHRDRRSNFRTAHAFSVKRVFDGTANPTLDNDDHVYIFTRGEVQMLAAAAALSLTSQPLTASPSTGDSSGTTAATTATPQQLQQTQTQIQSITNPADAAALAQANGLSQSDLQRLAASGQVPAGTSAAGLAAAASAAQSRSGAGNTVNPNDLSSFPEQFAPGATVDTTQPQAQAATIQDLADRLQMSSTELVRFARDYLVWVNGQVRGEGPYLVDTGTNLQDLVQAAGGFQLQADLSAVEVTTTTISPLTGTSETIRTLYHATGGQFASVILKPLDSVRVRPVYSDRDAGQVTITGQVKFPGTFDVTRGEKLSSVLLRAGGLTNEGYPYGAVFTRISAQKAEAQGNQRAASSLENQLATVAADPQVTPTQVSYLANLAQSMRNAPVIGRITVTADPVVLATHPELDMLMEPGDKIYVPKRPSTVAVSGEVLNPGAFQYREGLAAEDYLQLAGGENSDADNSSVFVLLPDGTAKPYRGSWWRFGSGDRIPPGSTIIVPRDPRPFVLSQFLQVSIDLVSKLALTAASVAVIGR
jgi:protein involved in polysaccharide export with SLBB domain